MQTNVCTEGDDDFMKRHRVRTNNGAAQSNAAPTPRINCDIASGGASSEAITNATMLLITIFLFIK